MYFDAVLDRKYLPKFNGTPEETRRWLEGRPDVDLLQVCVGSTMEVIPVWEYMTRGDSQEKHSL